MSGVNSWGWPSKILIIYHQAHLIFLKRIFKSKQMSHSFSPAAAGLGRIIHDFSHLMKCSEENIHKYRAEVFCLFPFSALAETDCRQAEIPKHRKAGEK